MASPPPELPEEPLLSQDERREPPPWSKESVENRRPTPPPLDPIDPRDPTDPRESRRGNGDMESRRNVIESFLDDKFGLRKASPIFAVE